MARGICARCYDRHRRAGTLGRFGRKRNGTITRPGRNGTRYRYLNLPDHPMACSDGFVAEHRMVMYDLGLLTDRDDEVHHLDENGLNNDPGNLEVMTTGGHRRLHARMGGAVNQYGVFRAVAGRVCVVEGCTGPVRSRDWCTKHYTRWLREV